MVGFGKPAAEVLESILLANPAVESLDIFSSHPAPWIQDRMGEGRVLATVIESALTMREELGVPFWDAAFIQASIRGEFDIELFHQATYHQSPSNVQTLRIDGSLREQLEAAAEGLARDEFLVASSRLRMRNGDTMHLPMLDF